MSYQNCTRVCFSLEECPLAKPRSCKFHVNQDLDYWFFSLVRDQWCRRCGFWSSEPAILQMNKTYVPGFGRLYEMATRRYYMKRVKETIPAYASMHNSQIWLSYSQNQKRQISLSSRHGWNQTQELAICSWLGGEWAWEAGIFAPWGTGIWL